MRKLKTNTCIAIATPLLLAGIFALSACNKKDEAVAPTPTAADSETAAQLDPAETGIDSTTSSARETEPAPPVNTMAEAQDYTKAIWLERGYKTLYLIDALEEVNTDKPRIHVVVEMEALNDKRRYVGYTVCNDKGHCTLESELMKDDWLRMRDSWAHNKEPDFLPSIPDDREEPPAEESSDARDSQPQTMLAP